MALLNGTISTPVNIHLYLLLKSHALDSDDICWSRLSYQRNTAAHQCLFPCLLKSSLLSTQTLAQESAVDDPEN